MALPRYITSTQRSTLNAPCLASPPTTVVNVGNWDNSLKICNTFVGFEAARPLEPTMKLVGPIMSDELSPLTQHLSSFPNTKQRVVYIAFGSGVVLSKKDVQILFSAVTQLVEEGKADGIVWALGKTPTPPLRHHKSALKWMARLCMPKSSSTTNIPRFNLPAGLPKSPSFPTPPSASSSPMAALNPSLKEYTPAPPSSPCPSSATSTAMAARLLRWALAATPTASPKPLLPSTKL
ncbi:hypothetical protein DSO57_1039490 [Entomophthora muscae]|uniref:Uncharacterized protein n=1 Tax=Entomophthora muscae TaxID=34485 RepID=A0ACC2SML6_9FUNG|nr:hypothetical protein DSO57_1039490 [Entomophthora muscae]